MNLSGKGRFAPGISGPALNVDLDDEPAPPSSMAGRASVARLRQCCASLTISAKALGASPNAGVFLQATAAGTAPTLGALKQLLVLAGATVPAVCTGFRAR